MLTVRTSENTVITSFRLISERQDFSSVRTGENTVRARARIQIAQTIKAKFFPRNVNFSSPAVIFDNVPDCHILLLKSVL